MRILVIGYSNQADDMSALAGWPHVESPFHDGERAAQAKVGLAEKLEPIGRRIVRAFMPAEHRELFEKLPYLVLGAVDEGGQPHATVVAGTSSGAGFVRAPDERTLQIGALPRQGDPVRAILDGYSEPGLGAAAAAEPASAPGSPSASGDDPAAASSSGSFSGSASGSGSGSASAPGSGSASARSSASGAATARLPIAVLGIELSTRRRDRANGDVVSVDEHGLTVRVRQSFGNCPKYIQGRHPLERLPLLPGGPAPAVSLASQLTNDIIDFVRNADTFFLASSTPPALRSAAAGVDVSHRGGPPGFVAVERDPATGGVVLFIPDYSGNFLFNTLGNLALEPRCGLAFPDFETGALLSLTGVATVSWDDPRIAELPGAERLLSVRVTGATWIPGALPWRFSRPEPSPYLP